MRLGAVVLDSGNAEQLAEFYQQLLGWTKHRNKMGFLYLSDGGDGIRLLFQEDAHYERPTWPSEQGRQQQMTHLDFYVDDLAREVSHAISCGAELAAVQYSEFWRVLIDPAGHPFCMAQIPAKK